MAHAENRGRRLRQCNSFARDQWLSNGQKEVHRTQKKSHQMKHQQDPRSVIIGAGVGAHPPQPNRSLDLLSPEEGQIQIWDPFHYVE